ncbi:MAG: aminoacyl-tRNA hydrolase [Planctomycetota bacterium]|nr:aminoacyl-tRNA hydrolase [Planctomycetota bacterium]
MKLIVGLGNPGPAYERTRHNAGFMAIDLLVERHARSAAARGRFNAVTFEASLPGASGPEKCLLMKPTTFMNRSGQSVGEALRFFKLSAQSDLLVLVDDVYLPCGTIRLRESGGDGGHNGLADIQRALGSDAYARCRVGIDPPGIIPQADYVLGKFTEEQGPLIRQGIEKAADATETFVRSGITAAMNRFNAKDPPRPKPPPRPPERPGEALADGGERGKGGAAGGSGGSGGSGGGTSKTTTHTQGSIE